MDAQETAKREVAYNVGERKEGLSDDQTFVHARRAYSLFTQARVKRAKPKRAKEFWVTGGCLRGVRVAQAECHQTKERAVFLVDTALSLFAYPGNTDLGHYPSPTSQTSQL